MPTFILTLGLTLTLTIFVGGLIIMASNYRVPAARYDQPSAQDRLETMIKLQSKPEDPALALAIQEHEVLSPEFLEWTAEQDGGLGHPATCRDCYPPSQPGRSEAEDYSGLSPDERRDMCAIEDIHDYDTYDTDYCKWCGEAKPGERELFPGWGVG